MISETTYMGIGLRNDYYRYSEKLPLFGAVCLPVLWGIFGIAAGTMAGVICRYNVIPIIDGIVAFISGLVVAVAGNFLSKTLQIRNSTYNIAVGLLVGYLMVHSAWAGLIWAGSDYAVYTLHPEKLSFMSQLLLKNDVFWYLVPMTAVLVAPSILAPPIFLSGSLPYCEHCNRWLTAADGTIIEPLKCSPSDLRGMERKLRKNDFSTLKSCPKTTSNPHLRLKIHQCPSCNAFCILSLEFIMTLFNQKGEKSVKKEHIAKNLIISQHAYRELKSHWM